MAYAPRILEVEWGRGFCTSNGFYYVVSSKYWGNGGSGPLASCPPPPSGFGITDYWHFNVSKIKPATYSVISISLPLTSPIFRSLKYGFCKWSYFDIMNLLSVEHFFLTFFQDQYWSGKKVRKKCATGQRFICTEVTSYEIYALDVFSCYNLYVQVFGTSSYCFGFTNFSRYSRN